MVRPQPKLVVRWGVLLSFALFPFRSTSMLFFPTRVRINRLPREKEKKWKQKLGDGLTWYEDQGNQRWEGCFLLRGLPGRVQGLVRYHSPFGGTPTFTKYLGSRKITYVHFLLNTRYPFSFQNGSTVTGIDLWRAYPAPGIVSDFHSRLLTWQSCGMGNILLSITSKSQPREVN